MDDFGLLLVVDLSSHANKFKPVFSHFDNVVLMSKEKQNAINYLFAFKLFHRFLIIIIEKFIFNFNGPKWFVDIMLVWINEIINSNVDIKQKVYDVIEMNCYGMF